MRISRRGPSDQSSESGVVATSFSKPSKFILGTASFANHYGLRGSGVATVADVNSLASRARAFGVKGVDTAPSYGGAEAIIGVSNLRDFETFTKFRKEATSMSSQEIISSLEGSLSRLNLESIAGLTFHDSADLLSNAKEAQSAINELVDSERIASWGVSVYEVSEVLAIVENGFRPDYIQAPVNVLDQRFLAFEVRSFLSSNRINLQARSVFLQGLLVNSKFQTVKFAEWASTWALLRDRVLTSGLSPAQFCFSFVEQQECVHQVVVGVNEPDEISELFESGFGRDSIHELTSDLASNELELIDPRRWRHE